MSDEWARHERVSSEPSVWMISENNNNVHISGMKKAPVDKISIGNDAPHVIDQNLENDRNHKYEKI